MEAASFFTTLLLSSIPSFFFPKNVGIRIGSLLSSIVINCINLSSHPKLALYSFIGHIIGDFCILRYDTEQNFTFLHHVVTLTLSVYTLQEWQDTYLFFNGVYLLLLMEITTPSLHLGWLFRHYGFKGFALVFGSICLLLWEIRLITPYLVLVQLHECTDCTSAFIEISTYLLASLFLLQVYWCIKLLGVVSHAFLESWKKEVT